MNVCSICRSPPRLLPVLSAVLLCTAGVHAQDWPQYLGPTRDGVAGPPAVPLATHWPDAGPPLRWRTPTSGGYGGPSIFSNRVYFVDSQRLTERDGAPWDGMRESLRCLDFATGAELWRLDQDLTCRTRAASVPSVDGRYVSYVSSQGDLAMVEAASGRLLWRKPLQDAEEQEVLRHAFAQSPLFIGDTVVVAADNRSVGLAAYRKEDGAVVWQTPSFHELMGRAHDLEPHKWSSPALVTLHGRAQVIQLVLDGGVSVDPATGAVLWTHTQWSTPSKVPPVSLLASNRLFLTQGYSGDSQIVDVGLSADGVWTTHVVTNVPAKASCHPAVPYEGFLYLNAHPRQEREDIGLACLDREGHVRWQTRKGSVGEGFGDSGLLRSGELLLAFSARDGSLVMLQATPEHYRELGRARVSSRPSGFSSLLAPMALAHGQLVLRCPEAIHCYDLRVGATPRDDAPTPEEDLLGEDPGSSGPMTGDDTCL